MSENERIVCEFLRKIAQSREWEYLGEVEHYWIDELCDELNKQLKVENDKLRGIVRDLHKALFTLDIDHCQACPRDNINGPCTKFAVWGNDKCSIEKDMRELGIEVR